MEIRILGPLRGRGRAATRSTCPAARPGCCWRRWPCTPTRWSPSIGFSSSCGAAEPPDTAANTLQTYVSHLRRSLEPDRTPREPSRLLITREPGYLLAVEPDQIDAVRFERLVREARLVLGTAPDTAVALLRTALSLWRGEPLADFTFEPFAQSEITRLAELQIAAIEDRIEAELALGGHAALCGELAQLVREHPLRERLSGQLMVALYRCGRQAEALRAYRDLRATLAEQLGIDPSPALGRLEEAILQQRPSLNWPPAAAEAAPLPVSSPVTAAVDVPVGLPVDGMLSAARAAWGGAAGRKPSPCTPPPTNEPSSAAPTSTPSPRWRSCSGGRTSRTPPGSAHTRHSWPRAGHGWPR